jgi:hypothetical protein
MGRQTVLYGKPVIWNSTGTKDYYKAVWPGISADHFQHGSEDGLTGGGFTGGKYEFVSAQWQKRNIQSLAPYGSLYPKTIYIMEGDSPAFLGLIPNGLNVPEHPEYGGWSGRYCQRVWREAGESHPVWSGAPDTVTGNDGNLHCSPQAGLWRWREDFQRDFAARMQWTVRGRYEECVHPPIVRIDRPAKWSVFCSEAVSVDASQSESPDSLPLRFKWFLYPEAGPQPFPKIELDDDRATAVRFVVPELPAGAHEATAHLILAVTNSRSYEITRYQRIELCIRNR